MVCKNKLSLHPNINDNNYGLHLVSAWTISHFSLLSAKNEIILFIMLNNKRR